MPTTVVFIGGEKITVSAELTDMADMLSRARPERVERVHGGGPRQAYLNPRNVLYVEESHSRVPDYS
jgi:hypothetical protein